MRLRSEGYSFSKIGQMIGVSRQRATKYTSEHEATATTPCIIEGSLPLSSLSAPVPLSLAPDPHLYAGNFCSDDRVLSSASEARKPGNFALDLGADLVPRIGAPGDDVADCAAVLIPCFHSWSRAPCMAAQIA